MWLLGNLKHFSGLLYICWMELPKRIRFQFHPWNSMEFQLHEGGGWRGPSVMASQRMWVPLPLSLSGKCLPVILYLPKLYTGFYTRPSRRNQGLIDHTSAQPPRARADNCLRTWISTCAGCFHIFTTASRCPLSCLGCSPKMAGAPRTDEGGCQSLGSP